jgi:hypothetical protein
VLDALLFDEPAGRRIEPPGDQRVAAERSRDRKLVRRRDENCMRLRYRLDHLMRRSQPAARLDLAHRDEVIVIRGAEQPATRAIGRQERERPRHANLIERLHHPAHWIDREACDAERFVAQPGEHQAPIGRIRERRELAAEHVLDERELAARHIQLEHEQLAALGIRNVGERALDGLRH